MFPRRLAVVPGKLLFALGYTQLTAIAAAHRWR
jgi:hypothetical protein